MLVFIDTEYTDALDCDLISIGMVCEDDHYAFYAERSDFQVDWCNSFVKAAVLPLLGLVSRTFDRVQLTNELISWFASLPFDVTIACDSFTDWELLLDALDGAHPSNIIGCHDLRTNSNSVAFYNAAAEYHNHFGPRHHAMHDARAHRYGWMCCNEA